MTNYYVLEVELCYKTIMSDGEHVGDDLDAVVGHLQDTLGAKDVSVDLDKTTRSVVISMLVTASPGETPETTIGKGLGDIRTALHYSGANTPAWPLPSDFHLCAISLDEAKMPASDMDDRLGELALA